MNRYILIVLSLSLWGSIVACKKEIIPPAIETEPPVVTRTDEQKLRDSIYHYYKLYSLWTDHITPQDPISRFTDNYRGAEEVLKALMAQTPRHPGYNGPIDRFSHIDFISSGSNSARADNADGYGIFTTVLWDGSSQHGYIHAFFIEGGSPAEQAGIKRGDRLITVNGRTDLAVPISGGIITDQSNINFVNSALEGSHLELEVAHTDGERQNYSLAYQTYPINPLLKDTVYVLGAKKIGYLAMSSFEEIYKAGNMPTPLLTDLETVFSKFEQEAIDDLILDLRYNIGGYMHTAEYFANKMINEKGKNQLMYQYETNAYLQSRASGNRRFEFRDVYYTKNNSLNIQNLYFLVTENTASASEVLMSATKPYFGVQIIAETDRTYGKPVGYFPQEIMGEVDLWVASFKAFHPSGYKDYWDGISATKTDVLDNILRDYGDPEESMIAEALSHATTGGYLAAGNQQRASVARSSQAATTVKKIQDINKLKPRNLIKK